MGEPVMANLHPRLGIYTSIGFRSYDGFITVVLGDPFLDAAGAIRADVVAKHARWDFLVVLGGSEFFARPDIPAAIRAINPSAKIIWGGGFTSTYLTPTHLLDPAVALAFQDKILNLAAPYGYIRSLPYGDHFNPYLARAGPTTAFSPVDMNIANPAVIDALVELYTLGGPPAVRYKNAYVVGNPIFNGMFFDFAQHEVSSGGLDQIDLAFAGFAGNEPGYRAAYRAGHTELFRRLRLAAPAGFTIGINDGGFTDPNENGYINGTMREGFPNQSGGTWDKNMIDNLQGGTHYPGLFTNDVQLVQPPDSWLNMLPGAYSGNYDPLGYTIDPAQNLRQCRFGLGSATLAEALWSLTENTAPFHDSHYDVWFPEYSIDRATMTPVDALANPAFRGWLGLARGAAYQVTGGVWRRDFANGTVLVNPTGGAVAVPLGTVMRRILSGIPGDTVNVGGMVNQVTVNALDGIFLGSMGPQRGNRQAIVGPLLPKGRE